MTEQEKKFSEKQLLTAISITFVIAVLLSILWINFMVQKYTIYTCFYKNKTTNLTIWEKNVSYSDMINDKGFYNPNI